MAWNLERYNQFKSERFTPFYDLLALAKVKPGMSVIDLGCGTGELTRKLVDALPGATVLGIDSSEEMLIDSKAFTNDHVRFEQLTIEAQVDRKEKYDLVFSNAAIQWVENHEVLLSKIISRIKPGGQLLIQMPAQHHNISNRMLNELAQTEPFRTALGGYIRIPPVLDIDEYSRIFFENNSQSMTVFEKIYPLVLKDPEALFDWVSGTALIPYVEKLEGEVREHFIHAYKQLLAAKFSSTPVFYPFKRIILEAVF